MAEVSDAVQRVEASLWFALLLLLGRVLHVCPVWQKA